MKTVLAILFIAMIAVACAPAQTEQPASNIDLPPPPPLPMDTANGPVASSTDAAPLEVTMTAADWEFAPKEIRAKKGQVVRVTVTSTDVAHGIAIEGYDAHVEFANGETKTLEFTADKAGEFTFYCNVPCGQGHRTMRGKLIVE